MKVDWPIGTPEERAAARGEIPGQWTNANPFLNPYRINGQGELQYHTGVDLNLNLPGDWNADAHQPLYAPAAGSIVFAGPGGGSWGQIVVGLSTDPLTGSLFEWRLGHIENPTVQSGDRVDLGDQVGQVGNGDGYYGPGGHHLHFDLCVTDLLRTKPNQWPGANKALLLLHYVDPVAFIRERYAVSPDINTAHYFRELLAGKPADTPVTVIFGLPPVREPIQTVEALSLTTGEILGVLPDVDQPVEWETRYVASLNGATIRIAPAGPKLVVNGQNVVLRDGTPIRVSKTFVTAVLNSVSYDWHQVDEPVKGWIAGSLTSKNP